MVPAAAWRSVSSSVSSESDDDFLVPNITHSHYLQYTQ
jgi:hypothetical protein